MPSKHRRCILRCVGFSHIFRFPRDEAGRRLWMQKVGFTKIPNSAALCDRHFSEVMKPPRCTNKILQWAVPDMNLPEVKLSQQDQDKDKEDDELSTESMLNGTSTDHKEDEENNKTSNDASDQSVDHDHQMGDDPLDFEDMIDLQNNSKANHNGSDHLDEELEEMFDDGVEKFFEETHQSIGTSPIMQSTNGDVSDEDTISHPEEPLEINSTFKRKLIACVRRRRILYDPAHPCFGNIEKKSRAWTRIGKILKLDGTVCRELWLNLRYNYQNHVRNLRLWLAGESSNQRERPRIQFENDFIFLWRFIADSSTIEDINGVLSETANIISHNVIDKTPDTNNSIVMNDLEDEENVRSKNFVGDLIEAVQSYREMYDTNHANYGNPKRRSIIWQGIANELKEKATKCLFSWIQILMRYELELTSNQYSYLVVKMSFMEKHIKADEKSPFKRTTLLTNKWFEPLYKVDEQHLLIAAMITSKRTRPYFANIDCPFATIGLLKVENWNTVARIRKITPQQCEVTWIIIQMMYCELSEYRRNNCRLKDVWELESIITKLRDTIVRKLVPISNQPDFVEPSTSNIDDPLPMMEDTPNDIEMGIIQDNNPQTALPTTHGTPPKQPEKPKNEILFKIPGKNPEDPDEVVHFNLDVPLSELGETSVFDIGSVMENAHIVVMKPYKGHLKVHLFTLEKRKEFIGEVMARPIIFNEPCKTSRVSRLFMSEISTDIKLPVDACLAFWEYIVEKSLFVDYHPSWKKTKESKWIPAPYPIFDKFLKLAESKNWNELNSVLADFMQEIGNFPLIYSDLKINSSWNRRQCYIRDIAEVWAILARKFSVLENHKVIWEKFKNIFLLYMSEIELSMYNPWPPFWAPVFSKMKFLMEFKYSPKDPIYYVLRYKINEEIELCKQNTNSNLEKLNPVTNAKVIFRLLKENEYLEDFTWVNRARFISKLKSFPMLYDIKHEQFGNKEAKLDAWQEMALLFHCTVGECHLIFQHLMKSYLILRARDPNQICRVNAKYWENMTYIYSCAMPNSVDPKTITGRSFRLSSNGSTIKLAEEFQAEISLVDAKPRLICKNLASAVNSLPEELQPTVTQNLKYIFSEYTRIQNEEIVVDVQNI